MIKLTASLCRAIGLEPNGMDVLRRPDGTTCRHTVPVPDRYEVVAFAARIGAPPDHLRHVCRVIRGRRGYVRWKPDRAEVEHAARGVLSVMYAERYRAARDQYREVRTREDGKIVVRLRA